MLKKLGIFIACLLITNVCFGATFNVKDYGAKGDGFSNDYSAIKKVIDQINKLKTGVIYFPKGTYYIGEYHHDNNNISDLELINCDDVKIYGDAAIISLKGDFNRTITRTSSKHVFSNISSIIPIKISNCKNVSIESLEIDGNIDQTTRDKGVVEGLGYLVYISESANVTLRNLYLHHAQTDGLIIRGKNKPTINLSAFNLIMANNARQGMTIGALFDGRFVNCKFINTGITEGAYGKHAPSAGVDIEPGNQSKLAVNNIKFEQCSFKNNLGAQFICTSPQSSTNISIVNCEIESAVNSSKYQLILAGDNMLVQNSKINCANGNVYITWGNLQTGNVVFKDNEIKSALNGIVCIKKENIGKIVISGNQITYTGITPVKSFFPYIQSKGLTFTNNKIFIPAKLLKASGYSALVQLADTAYDNSFYTELNHIQPKVSYSGVKSLTKN